MITVIFSVDPKITQLMNDHFGLIKLNINENTPDFQIFRLWWVVLLESKKDDASFRNAFLYWYSEFNPDLILFVWTATWIGSEVREWDVILPNVFFEYNANIEDITLDKANRDSFLKDPIFLEQYNLQTDYNFENFWLSIGWISVTSQNKIEKTAENFDKIRIAYEADLADNYSYTFVDEAKKLDLLNKTYVILWVSASHEETPIEHITHIVSFLLDNISWELSWKITDEIIE